ncbi:MAG: hypothetical protein HUU37_06440, partial [Bdellovibrionales bacterium]|nr:hypothetical protein [Bdellovibrionales bacterium]
MKNFLWIAVLAATSAQAGKEAEIVKRDLEFGGVKFKACEEVGMVSAGAYKKNKEFWDQAMSQCEGVRDMVQVLPDTGFFNTILGKLGEDADEARSVEFLQIVGRQALANAEFNLKTTEKLIACAKGDTSSATCGELLGDLRKRYAAHRQEARRSLALSAYNYNQVPGKEFEGNEINERLLQVPGVIAPKQPPLSASEKAAALKQFAADTEAFAAEYTKMMASAAKNRDEMRARGVPESEVRRTFRILEGWKGKVNELDPNYQDFVRRSRHGRHTEYRLKYMETLQKAPILAFLGSENPSDAEIAQALAEFRKNGEAELAFIKKTFAKTGERTVTNEFGREEALPQSHNATMKDLLPFMKYGGVVNEIVMQNPGLCRAATGLANHVSNTDTRDNVALALSMIGGAGTAMVKAPRLLAGTALAGLSPGAVGVMVAAPIGAYYPVSDSMAATRAERRAYTAPEMERFGKPLGTVEEAQEARSMAGLSVALMPLDWVGGGAVLAKVGGAAVVGGAAGKALQMSARQKLRQSLVKKGMTKAEIDGFFKRLDSRDPEVASRAASALMKEFELGPEELSLMRTAAQRGFLGKGGDQLRYVDLLMKDLPADVAERKLASRRALEIVKEINPSLLNEGNREGVARAVVAAASFGHKDPKHIARVVTEWDRGHEGLARTFQEAKKLLKGRNLASVSATEMDDAFEKALRAQISESPAFKQMSKE